MKIARRIVFPLIWMIIFAVIAVALVKIAFIDGLKPQASAAYPGAQITAPTVPATKATVDNIVNVKGAVQNDAAVPLPSTAAGTVLYRYVEVKAVVAAGDKLFQVKSEIVPAAVDSAAVGADGSVDGTADGTAMRPVAPAKRVFAYHDVTAPSAGLLSSFTVLLDQQVSVGQVLGSIAPQTLSVQGTLTTDQQFRLLGRPTTATVTAASGPAPFDCGTVSIGSAPAPAAGGAGTGVAGSAVVNPAAGVLYTAPSGPGGAGSAGPQDSAAGGGAGSGTVTCAVPAGTTVFAGLGATINVIAGSAQNVITVPVTAVKGTYQNGVVWIPGEDGAPAERKVGLGLSDGTNIEITSGLAEGEQVLQFVPGSPAPDQPGQFGPMG